MPITQDIEIIPKKADGTPLLGKIASVRTLNTAVATAVMLDDDTARVTRVALGSTSLIATVDGIDSAPIPITVRREVAILTLGTVPEYGMIGETHQLTWTAQDPGGVEIDNVTPVFQSSHPAFATISATGLITFIADSGAVQVVITATADAVVQQRSVFVVPSIRALILANGGVEWVPGAGDRQKPRTIGPGITNFEVENASAGNGPVCFLDANGRPRVVGDGVRHARKPPTVSGAFHFHGITVVGTDTVPVPGITPDSFGRIFAITDSTKLTIHPTNEGETAWKGGGMEFNFEADRFTKLGGRRWLRAHIYLRAPLAQDVGKEIQFVLTSSAQVVARSTIVLTAVMTRYELKGWVEGDELVQGNVHFVFPPTLAAPSQVSVYGPGLAPAEGDLPFDLIGADYRWAADTTDGVAADAWLARRAWPVGPLGLFVGDVAYNAAAGSWSLIGSNWQDENGVCTLAAGTTRNPDQGMLEVGASPTGETMFVDITMPAGARRRMADAQATPFDSLNATDSAQLKGVGMLVVAYIAAGAAGALPADGALEAYCNPSNGDGGVKVGPMKRYRRVPNTNVWEYRGLTAPYSFTHTSTLFRGGIQNASAGALRFDIGPLIIANSAANGARDESGLWPADYWAYWYGGLATAEAKKQQVKAQRPSIYPQSALFNRVAGAYINRFAIPYNPAADLPAAAGMQEIVKQISDGGVTGNFGDTLNAQFRCGKADTGQTPEFHMGLEAFPGSGDASASAGVQLTGADASLFAQTFTHYDTILRWNGRAIVDWAINPVNLSTVLSGPGWRTDGITGPTTGPDEFSANAWCPWDDRDFRMALQGWGFGVCVVKGVMPSRAACLAILAAWGPRQKLDFATGLKVAA